MGLLYLILKYELKNFRNYIFQRGSRLLGFALGMFLELIYILLLFYVFPPSNFLFLFTQFKNLIALSMPAFVALVIYISFSAGLSLIITARKGIRNQLQIFMLGPTNPHRVIFYFLCIQALVASTLITEIMLPATLWVLLAAGFSSIAIFSFLAILIIAIISFSFVGGLVALVYIRLGTRKRIYLSLFMAIAFGFFYMGLYGYDYFEGLISAIIKAFYTDLSPFKWLSAPLLIGMIPYELLTIYIGAGMAFLLFPGFVSYKVIVNRFMEGKIQPPVEIYRYKLQTGLIDKLFKPPLRGLLRKELRLISREPNLVGLLVAMLFLTIAISIGMSLSVRSTESISRSFTFIMVAMPSIFILFMLPASYISSSLAMERRGLAILYSSPITGADILKPKLTILLFVQFFTVGIQLFIISILFLPPLSAVLFALAIYVTVILSGIGIGTYVGTKYVKIKAENPRKAITGVGSITLMVVGFVLFGSLSVIVFIFSFISQVLGSFLILGIMSISIILAEEFVKESAKHLEKIESTEYL